MRLFPPFCRTQDRTMSRKVFMLKQDDRLPSHVPSCQGKQQQEFIIRTQFYFMLNFINQNIVYILSTPTFIWQIHLSSMLKPTCSGIAWKICRRGMMDDINFTEALTTQTQITRRAHSIAHDPIETCSTRSTHYTPTRSQKPARYSRSFLPQRHSTKHLGKFVCVGATQM